MHVQPQKQMQTRNQHRITLDSPDFERVKDGKKIYLARRKTPTTDAWRIGDIVVVYHRDVANATTYHHKFQAVITDMHAFDSFEDAMAMVHTDECSQGNSGNSGNHGIIGSVYVFKLCV